MIGLNYMESTYFIGSQRKENEFRIQLIISGEFRVSRRYKSSLKYR